MKTILITLCSSLLLLSCEIDEEKNLLFRLKDRLQAIGTWQSGKGTDRFEFSADGTFTAKINATTGTPKSGSGSFRYSEVISDSGYGSNKTFGYFVLTWSSPLKQAEKTSTLRVQKDTKDDLYFEYERVRYVQIQ